MALVAKKRAEFEAGFGAGDWMVRVGRGAERRPVMGRCSVYPGPRVLRLRGPRTGAAGVPLVLAWNRGRCTVSTIAHDLSEQCRPRNLANQTAMGRELRVQFTQRGRTSAFLSRQATRFVNVNSSTQRVRMRASRNASPGGKLIRCTVWPSPVQASSTTRGLAGSASSRSWPNRNSIAL